jgi:hypothetical protein
MRHDKRKKRPAELIFSSFNKPPFLNRQASVGKTGCATTRFGLESGDRGQDMIFLMP